MRTSSDRETHRHFMSAKGNEVSEQAVRADRGEGDGGRDRRSPPPESVCRELDTGLLTATVLSHRLALVPRTVGGRRTLRSGTEAPHHHRTDCDVELSAPRRCSPSVCTATECCSCSLRHAAEGIDGRECA